LKRPVIERKGESGQAVLLVLVGLSIFLIGAAGLALDGSHLYAQRQMAQAAADAAAEAGILSIFDGTNSVAANAHRFGTTNFTCATSDARTPCYYAQTMNGFNAATDTVSVDFPDAATVGVATGTLSASDPVNLLRVTVQRQVSTTLMALLGPAVSTVGASGTAAIVTVASPVPIIITHPTNPSTFSSNGNITIQICGGPSRSIQVNSSNSGTQNVSGNSNIVDLSHAGPLDPGDCSAGTGADFGDFGGPGAPLFNLSAGSTGHYVQPASPIQDPLKDVPAPAQPTTSRAGPIHVAGGNSTPSTLAPNYSGQGSCPAVNSPGGCDFYLPGNYPTGITASGSNNYVAYFFPGIYYMDSTGFTSGANGNMQMYSGANPDTTANGTGSGMLVYNTGTGLFIVGKNAGATLVGSDDTSVYKGILFFQDRSAPAHTTKNTDDHIIGGGGALALTGTIYINNSLSVMTGSRYQLLQLQGGGGSNTFIKGEIITNQLLLGGSGTIRMNLNPAAVTPVRQVALVN
jgi:Flp pilus assembly protein TadG